MPEAFAQDTIIHRLVVQEASKVNIDGKTSVGNFRCSNSTYSGNDTLILNKVKNEKSPKFRRGTVSLPAKSFDCGMKVMTNDFIDVIQAEKHPTITMKFLSAIRLPKYSPTEEKLKCRLMITLANVSREVEMTCIISKDEKGIIHLKGKRQFYFSDFNLTPPKKMLGMIKVHDKLEVEFQLALIRLPD